MHRSALPLFIRLSLGGAMRVFTPDGPGFARLTVMDARGVADSVMVGIE